MKNEKLLKFFNIVLILFILFNFGSTIWQQKLQYTNINFWKNFSELTNIYDNSQYVSKHPKGWIADERINAYAGAKYIRGVAPQLVAPDTPPLGRYLIGLSELIFNNENIITIVSGIVSIAFIYLTSRKIYSSKTTSLFLIACITLEPIFKNQFVYTPLLDIIQLMFLSLAFYFFNNAIWCVEKKSNGEFKWFLLAQLSLGAFVATKFFITGLTILAAFYLVILTHRFKKELILTTSLIPIPVFVLLISYIRAFAYGYNLKSFLGIQKWIFLYHKTQLILPFSIWPLLMLNRWYVWFGNKPVLHDPQWLITWPISTLISLVTIILYIIKKIKYNYSVEVIMAWVFFYIAFLSVGQITTRYFVILIPYLYMISLFGAEKFILSLGKK